MISRGLPLTVTSRSLQDIKIQTGALTASQFETFLAKLTEMQFAVPSALHVEIKFASTPTPLSPLIEGVPSDESPSNGKSTVPKAIKSAPISKSKPSTHCTQTLDFASSGSSSDVTSISENGSNCDTDADQSAPRKLVFENVGVPPPGKNAF